MGRNLLSHGSKVKSNKEIKHLLSVGKTPKYGEVIEDRIKRLGKVKIPKGKHKLFRSFVRIPRGIKI